MSSLRRSVPLPDTESLGLLTLLDNKVGEHCATPVHPELSAPNTERRLY